MKKMLPAAGLFVAICGLALFAARCTPDWYADIPCSTDKECPQDYHCENQKCTTGEAAGEPGFDVSVKSLDFGEVQVGESVTKDLSVKNTAKSGGQILVTPSLSTDYKAVAIDPKAEVAVTPQSSVKVKLTYNPTSAGAIPELYLVIQSNETGGPMRKIRLSGSATAPHLETDPVDKLTFDPMYLGAQTVTKTLRLLNTGKGTLSVKGIDLVQAADTGFSLVDAPTTFPQPIVENGLLELTVGFRPMTGGDKAGSIDITTNEYGRTSVSVALEGSTKACPKGYYDIHNNGTCDYHCEPKKSGPEVCDGEDNDCDGQVDNADIAQLCPNNKAATHADYLCSKGACVIKQCDVGWWDRDGKPENGCEAQCQLTNKDGQPCTKGDPGCGVEVCDGLDNDCNGKVDDGVITDMCAVDAVKMPHVQKDPGTIACDKDPADNKTRCLYTCEQGWANCVGAADIAANGCPTKVVDDVNNCGGCGKACSVPHATPKCVVDKCVVDKCDDGYWDIDTSDNAPGCEYGPCTLTDAKGQPCTKGDPGCGAEVCDGKDNNCNGKIDDATIDTLCPPKAHTTYACDQGACKITACDQGWYDADKDVSTGCECQAISQGGLDTCGAAKDLGQLADTGGSLVFTGNLTPPGKVEWYRFVGADDVNEDNNSGCDHYHVAVKLLQNPGNQYLFDVYVNDCDPGNPNQFHDCNDFSFSTYFTGSDANGPVGECPCTPLDNAGIPHCTDDTRTYYVRVFRANGATATCEPYQIEISNGKYKP